MVGQLRTLAARPEPVLGDSEPPVTPAPGDRQLLLVSPVSHIHMAYIHTDALSPLGKHLYPKTFT